MLSIVGKVFIAQSRLSNSCQIWDSDCQSLLLRQQKQTYKVTQKNINVAENRNLFIQNRMYIKVRPISDKTVINLHTRLKKDTHRDTGLEFSTLQ